MKNLRNKNQPPNADLVQKYLESSWDIVTAIYLNLPLLTALGSAVADGDLDTFLTEADIDTLAELNAILTDATLGDFASQAEAEAGVSNAKTMTPLRTAQAIAVLAAGIQNNFNAAGPPTVNDDSDDGYSAGSVWIDTTAVPHESYRLADPSVGAAVWLKTTLTSDELSLVALTGDSDDLIEGVVNLLMTAAERAKLFGIEAGATADQSGPEIKALYEAQANTNAFTDAEKANVAAAILDGDFVASEGMMKKDSAGTYRVVKTNLSAAVPPGTGNDATQGYSIGSLWVDTVAKKVYTCADATAGAAVWSSGGTEGGGGGLTPVFIDNTDSPYAASGGQFLFCDSAAGPIEVTMPAGVDQANISIVDSTGNASTNAITITPDGAETIHEDVEFVLDQNFGQVNAAYEAANTNWKVALVGYPEIIVGSGTALEAEIDARVKVVAPTANSGAPFGPATTFTVSANIDDDDVATFSMPLIEISAGTLVLASSDNTIAGSFAFRPRSGPWILTIAKTGNLNTTTGALTGTDGTDGFLTISAVGDNTLQVENRTGGLLFAVLTIGVTQ